MTVYFHDEFTLFSPLTRHREKAGNIKPNNKVSVVIAGEDQNFYKRRGLSMSGIATRVIDERRAEEFPLRLFCTHVLFDRLQGYARAVDAEHSPPEAIRPKDRVAVAE